MGRGYDAATFRILPNSTGSSSNALRTALAELNEGKWQAVVIPHYGRMLLRNTLLDSGLA